jgi:histone deacetylase complex regulatory component SIN3
LQTYQRESKPIQDVYSQVTQLFREAPDLLEDFKQFLPESAAQARAAAAAKAAAEDAANGAGPTNAQLSVGSARLPAVGTFPPPPSVAKEKGKKRGGQVAQPQMDPKAETVVGIGRGANKVSYSSFEMFKLFFFFFSPSITTHHYPYHSYHPHQPSLLPPSPLP